MQMLYTEYLCECGVCVEHLRPVGFDVPYKLDALFPECGKEFCLCTVSRMEKKDVEEDEECPF